MDKPILTLSTRDFLTGIAPSAHAEGRGLFHKARGVTAVYDPGGTASEENGLLQAGPSPTDIGGATVDDTIFAMDAGVVNGTTSVAIFYGSGGNIYSLLTNGTFTEETTGISTPRAGVKIWRNALYYWNAAQIGRSTDLTTFTANAITPTGLGSVKPMPHVFFDRLYYFHNAGERLDRLTDVTTVEEDVLDWETGYIGSGIADDGVYLAIALTPSTNSYSSFNMNKILFWDTNTSTWQREYYIQDPFIWNLKRLGNSIIAFGQYGIYEVSFNSGVRKILDRLIGFGTVGDFTSGYGVNRADIYNQRALMFGTDDSIDSLGQIDITIPSSYQKPLAIPDSVGTTTAILTRFIPGSVYVGTDGNKLYRYDFDGATRDTSRSAETVYIPLPTRMTVKAIEVIFGEPLASGDSLNIDLRSDEDTSAVDFGTISYASQGAVRSHRLISTGKHSGYENLKIILNFNGGAVKIKKIKVYADPQTT